MSKQKPRIPQHKECLNCGSPLSSQFCPECGQKNKEYNLTFKDFFSVFLEELLDVDSRVLRSLKLLFTKPGFLTTEYVKGRRVRYVPPVRIYLVASVVFFVILSLKAIIPDVKNNQFLKEYQETGGIEESLRGVMGGQVTSNDSLQFLEDMGIVATDPDSSAVNMSLTIGEQPFQLQEGDLLSNFSDNFAKMMFLLLPVAALQLKVLYWRRKKLYIEHLVFSLHVHAFIFSLLILTIILDYKLTMWLVIISSLIYLYIAMKQFYSQSYSKTATKMVLLLLSYGVTTLLVMALTMVVTAVGLVMGNA
ncbi:MAG: DUF3667 domain-containing protein [Candidatus Marinimicrobia bacterium]|jgi:hypothetical protein|nr:DUF3667 domain-containing protein [Candidatus Neomarinimicrobiota bacterium]MBT3576057.1 DUF3667 domain-containing protein [Candidatus Neomarinimicrobiota bacterium]MBT3949725.1 DUF3667 domain-containing protein [Candidatus Neomarinimicrobiota bacterium]MBT4254057.1 DUF3667 domain-containing protein [Candidatus Neomarinimicrobiota bacterium]MBT4479763.1 DUF3667 domain-containing protein [Candidatus Neomarinimicrobiota bacterium]